MTAVERTRRTQGHSARHQRRADLCVVGGAGRVGLPLALAFASRGQRVLIHDINSAALKTIAAGTMPFLEHGAEPLLREALSHRRLLLSSRYEDLGGVPAILVTIGTPVDEFLNPMLGGVVRWFDPMLRYLSREQIVILVSTVYPGTTEWVDRYLQSKGRAPKVAFCPERVVEGHMIEEFQTLPQIVSGTSQEAEDLAAALFLRIAPEVVRLRPVEAEFAKLFCNAYRYIRFATTNQFYMMANSSGLDYYRILRGIQHHYPRMEDVPGAGLSAGPCLLKDTMQLMAFYHNEFSLGYSAMLINEGLPLYIVDRLARQYDLSQMTIGLLGMAFKANIDDPRASLSYKLKKVLVFRAKRVLTTDPLVNSDPDLRPLEEVLANSQLLILCAPHSVYQRLKTGGTPVVDIWNFFGRGGLV